jgi:virginiamycin B lyase
MIGAITTDGTITEYPTSNGVNPGQITLGADGNLYFTEPAANRIGRISAKGAATDYPIPTDAAGPNGIALGPDGNIWFCETSVNKIGRLSIGLLSYSVTEFPLPNAGSQPTDIALGPDGALWFTEASGNRLGRITTSGVITEIPLSGGLESFGVAAGLDGGLWFTDPNVKKLARHSVAADVNRDGVTDIADVFYLVNYLFANGPVPK